MSAQFFRIEMEFIKKKSIKQVLKWSEFFIDSEIKDKYKHQIRLRWRLKYVKYKYV